MPRAPKPHPNIARIPEIIARLDEAYGVPEWRPSHDAISELVLTILSQNTSDLNSGRAFARLLERFPSWDAVAAAPLGELIEAIAPGGLAPTKAPRIQSALRDVRERTGGSDLRFLADMPLDEARDWLRSIHGVGPKTASCVLMFALGRPAMPVDTHVFRVAMRLGLIPERTPAARAASKASLAAATPRARKAPGAANPRRSPQPAATAAMTPEKAHALLEAAVPPAGFYAFHIGLIKHGRRTCVAQRPRCPSCVLRDLCPSAAVFHPELAAASTPNRRRGG
jgi:endonuclease-3